MNVLKLSINNKTIPIRQLVYDEKPILIGPMELLFYMDQLSFENNSLKIIADSVCFFVILSDFYLPDEKLLEKYKKYIAK